MSIPSRSDGAGTYFVTSATFNRRRLFQVAANAELFLEVLQKYRREDHFKLHAFVVLGNHPKPAIDNHFKTGHREAA
jgi:putative transposase